MDDVEIRLCVEGNRVVALMRNTGDSVLRIREIDYWDIVVAGETGEREGPAIQGICRSPTPRLILAPGDEQFQKDLLGQHFVLRAGKYKVFVYFESRNDTWGGTYELFPELCKHGVPPRGKELNDVLAISNTVTIDVVSQWEHT